MDGPDKTAIVTGASQGIGAGIKQAFVEQGFNVVANSRAMTQSAEVTASDRVAPVEGHIGEQAIAARIVDTALSRFGSIDALVNNAGLFFTKPFTQYTAEDVRSLLATNVEGFLYVTQLVIRQMLAQKSGGMIFRSKCHAFYIVPAANLSFSIACGKYLRQRMCSPPSSFVAEILYRITLK